MPVPRDMDLDLLFTRSGSHYRAQVVQSPAGDGQQATFERPFTDLELENIILKLGRFRHRTRRYEAAPVAVAKQAGGRLFEAVFAGTVGDCLRRSRDRAEAAQATLRIRLRLSDCPELADLPWELLYDQSDDWFLGLFGNTPVIRYIQPPVHPRSVQVALPLHILVIRSEPSGLPPLNLKSEWEHVAEALSELIDDGLLVVTELVAPTLSELRRAFLRDTFHVLHYIGRGAFDQDRGGILFLTDQAGQAVSITGEDLGVILHDHASMRLAVLNSCEGGRTDPQDPFAGVADKLIRRGIPAVVATQFEISDQAAAEFAPHFTASSLLDDPWMRRPPKRAWPYTRSALSNGQLRSSTYAPTMAACSAFHRTEPQQLTSIRTVLPKRAPLTSGRTRTRSFPAPSTLRRKTQAIAGASLQRVGALRPNNNALSPTEIRHPFRARKRALLKT